MKYQLPKLLWGTMLLSVAFLLQLSCISESSDPSISLDPNLTLENPSREQESYPLENLRMDPTTLKMLADLRAATANYHDLTNALAAGYELASACVSHPTMGAMGFHYVNFGYVDGNYNPTQPEALLYEEDKNGNMKLVGVEFVVVSAAWDAHHTMIPYFGTQIFDIALAPAPLPFDNYQLHVWVWRHNPSGIFTKFNPRVSCL
ncbi:hypothetical protein SAMN03080617_01416 [Algoriphagus alkaliphilus]|uniref:Uncharacterized protein n=2 Tax=Algoriphagus TaxID=246875 RepID=A0A1G5WYF0_9BACT|nr:hypothetical protein [Algoriphagus alkaliphilus]MBA4301865.1 hypothetical protein [Cyclobacterium sp.]SDA63208.1 hypothetical protein SAMN03080617_01416 [Algoriphagus alkaliphilus]